jgi:hypothetical protein
MKISNILAVIVSIASILFSLFSIWLTLGWRVRKARKAFEKQLIRQGMSKKDAKRLSAQYSKMKDEIINTFKGSLFRS